MLCGVTHVGNLTHQESFFVIPSIDSAKLKGDIFAITYDYNLGLDSREKEVSLFCKVRNLIQLAYPPQSSSEVHLFTLLKLLYKMVNWVIISYELSIPPKYPIVPFRFSVTYHKFQRNCRYFPVFFGIFFFFCGIFS